MSNDVGTAGHHQHRNEPAGAKQGMRAGGRFAILVPIWHGAATSHTPQNELVLVKPLRILLIIAASTRNNRPRYHQHSGPPSPSVGCSSMMAQFMCVMTSAHRNDGHRQSNQQPVRLCLLSSGRLRSTGLKGPLVTIERSSKCQH